MKTMLEKYVNPQPSRWEELTLRTASVDSAEVTASVERIVERVRRDGDRALRELAVELDGAAPGPLVVTPEEFEEAEASVTPSLKRALGNAADNIRRFHEAQLSREVSVETSPGVRCLQRSVPIARVGLYVPGGTAPLFSTVLMLALPARVAGCREIVLCTPPRNDGKVSPEILCAAHLCGVDRVIKAGGAQAIAAMAYGTESVPRVDKIFGPGNRFVTRAKQLVSVSQVAVDMPAGPSEVMVLADESADAVFVASDMLSQAEHGVDSQAMLVCADEAFADAVIDEIDRQLTALPRREALLRSLAGSRVVVLPDREDRIAFANLYAAEHLIVAMNDPWEVAGHITAAGSIFVGNWSPESAGDYASGTNHTLPTSGWARAYSGVNTESFMRRITYQELTPEGLAGLSETIVTMAEAEGLAGHANAVKLRMNRKNRTR